MILNHVSNRYDVAFLSYSVKAYNILFGPERVENTILIQYFSPAHVECGKVKAYELRANHINRFAVVIFFISRDEQIPKLKLWIK